MLDDLKALNQFGTLRSSLVLSLQSWAARHVQFRHLLLPALRVIRDMTRTPVHVAAQTTKSEVWLRSDDLIQSMLVLTQGLKVDSTASKDNEEQVHLPTEYASLHSVSTSLQASRVIDKLDTLFGPSSTGLTPVLISRLLPFTQDLAETYAQTISTRVYAVRSTYKLAYVVSRVILDLAQKGFCKPQEESDDKGDGQDGETVDGTGMGAGTGDKNVSKEIEEESQVEGLQGEQEEEQNEGQDKDDNDDDAVSMDDDFEGALGDAKEGEDDGEGSEGEDEDDRDDHVGDVDPLDPGAVDEKFWGDDEKEEQQQENDGKEDLMNQKDEGGESEMAAKESEGQQGKDKEKEQKESDDGPNNDNQNDEPEPNDLDDFDDKNDDHDDETGEGDDGKEQEAGIHDQDDVAMPEGDRLDLPDDMEIGDDEEGEAGDAEDFDDLPMGEDEVDPEQERESSDAGQANEDDGEADEDAPGPTGATEEDANEPDETLNPNVDTSAAADNQAQQSAEAGAGLDGAEQEGREEQGQQQDEQDVQMEAQGEG